MIQTEKLKQGKDFVNYKDNRPFSLSTHHFLRFLASHAGSSGTWRGRLKTPSMSRFPSSHSLHILYGK
jgi:hypothetical protein